MKRTLGAICSLLLLAGCAGKADDKASAGTGEQAAVVETAADTIKLDMAEHSVQTLPDYTRVETYVINNTAEVDVTLQAASGLEQNTAYMLQAADSAYEVYAGELAAVTIQCYEQGDDGGPAKVATLMMADVNGKIAIMGGDEETGGFVYENEAYKEFYLQSAQ